MAFGGIRVPRSDRGFTSRTNPFGQLLNCRDGHENGPRLFGSHSQVHDRSENPVAVTHLRRLNR